MKTRNDGKSVKRTLLKELKTVDKLFSDLERDKTLPTFAEHIALCIILGTSAKVNLKAMYPKVYSKVSSLIHSRWSDLNLK